MPSRPWNLFLHCPLHSSSIDCGALACGTKGNTNYLHYTDILLHTCIMSAFAGHSRWFVSSGVDDATRAASYSLVVKKIDFFGILASVVTPQNGRAAKSVVVARRARPRQNLPYVCGHTFRINYSYALQNAQSFLIVVTIVGCERARETFHATVHANCEVR